MDRWHAIKGFMNVLELRSYTAAARKLGLSRSHLSKQITSLEDGLGVRLLNRTTKHVSPTEIGEAYYDVCARAFGELENAEADLGALRRTPRGKLKILAPKSLAVLELVDASRSFADAYPELEVGGLHRGRIARHRRARLRPGAALRRAAGFGIGGEKDRILSPDPVRHPTLP